MLSKLATLAVLLSLFTSPVAAQSSQPPATSGASSSAGSSARDADNPSSPSWIHNKWVWVSAGLLASGATLAAIGHAKNPADAERDRYTVAGAVTAGAAVVVLLTKGISWRRTPITGSPPAPNASLRLPSHLPPVKYRLELVPLTPRVPE